MASLFSTLFIYSNFDTYRIVGETDLKRQIYRHSLQKVRLDGFSVGTRHLPSVISPPTRFCCARFTEDAPLRNPGRFRGFPVNWTLHFNPNLISVLVLFNRKFKFLIILYMVSCLKKELFSKEQFGHPPRTHTPLQMLSLVIPPVDSGVAMATCPSVKWPR